MVQHIARNDGEAFVLQRQLCWVAGQRADRMALGKRLFDKLATNTTGGTND